MRVLVPALASATLGMLGVWILTAHGFGDLVRWSQFREAIETEIRSVESLEIDSRGTGKGQQITALEVRWTYEVEGQSYGGEALSIHRTRDDFDGFRRELYRRLNSDTPGTCFYRADDPGMAVLDRRLRMPTFLLSLLFSVVPLVLAGILGRAAMDEHRNQG